MTSHTPSSPLIAIEVQPPVVHLGLNHPPLNVIHLPMMDELSRALADAESREDISVVVISGEGKCFSAGVAAEAHTKDHVETLLFKFHGIIRSLVSSRKISIAAVHGHCLGGGAELAMVCDMAITTDNADWGFPEVKLGCYPPVAATALASLVGQKRAADLILTGRTITGGEAAHIGLATRAVSELTLDREVSATIHQLSTLSSATLAATKKALYVWDAVHFDKGLAKTEKTYLEDLMKTEDAQEGIAAFLEKRKPVWKNK